MLNIDIFTGKILEEPDPNNIMEHMAWKIQTSVHAKIDAENSEKERIRLEAEKKAKEEEEKKLAEEKKATKNQIQLASSEEFAKLPDEVKEKVVDDFSEEIASKLAFQFDVHDKKDELKDAMKKASTSMMEVILKSQEEKVANKAEEKHIKAEEKKEDDKNIIDVEPKDIKTIEEKKPNKKKESKDSSFNNDPLVNHIRFDMSETDNESLVRGLLDQAFVRMPEYDYNLYVPGENDPVSSPYTCQIYEKKSGMAIDNFIIDPCYYYGKGIPAIYVPVIDGTVIFNDMVPLGLADAKGVLFRKVNMPGKKFMQAVPKVNVIKGTRNLWPDKACYMEVDMSNIQIDGSKEYAKLGHKIDNVIYTFYQYYKTEWVRFRVADYEDREHFSLISDPDVNYPPFTQPVKPLMIEIQVDKDEIIINKLPSETEIGRTQIVKINPYPNQLRGYIPPLPGEEKIEKENVVKPPIPINDLEKIKYYQKPEQNQQATLDPNKLLNLDGMLNSMLQYMGQAPQPMTI